MTRVPLGVVKECGGETEPLSHLEAYDGLLTRNSE